MSHTYNSAEKPGSKGCLEVETDKEKPRRFHYDSPFMTGKAEFVENRQMNPVEIGSEAGRKHDGFNIQNTAILQLRFPGENP